jgi:hypothetical protein
MNTFWETALLGPLKALWLKAVALLPNLLAMGIILTVGLVAAWAMGHLVERVLRIVGLDHLTNRLGVNAALIRGGIKHDPSYLVGRATFWIVGMFAAVAGLSALNLQPINQFAQSFVAYIPHLLTAGVILAVGHLLSNFVSRATLIAAVNGGLPPARLVAACSRWGVQLLAAAMAMEQLGIAKNIVVVGFGIAFGGVVLAAALAFGLGARDLTKDLLARQFRVKEAPFYQKDDLTHL